MRARPPARKRDKKVRNKSVAVLDIRSSEVCAAVGERGVNNTFIIKSKYSCAYDGYAEGELLDVGSFNSAVAEVLKNTIAAAGGGINRFYVGIPGEFLKTAVTDDTISFAAPQRIREADVNNVAAMSRPSDGHGFTVIYSSPVYYVLSDTRRVVSPVGYVSDSLRAKMSWYLCKDSFAECVRLAFKPVCPGVRLKFIPSPFSEINYLFEPQMRDSYVALLDIDYISSTYTVACGNGIVYSQAFSVGIGHIAALMMDELNIPFEVATKFLSRVNLNAKEMLTSVQEIRYNNVNYSYSTATLRDIIREGLDGICQMVEECIQTFAEKDMTGRPVYVTGEGLKVIRGTAEHLSNRLVCSVEAISPRVPYYDKPRFSSLLSLLDAALGDSSNS